jgi:dolichol-phosphate mannosyltransferase
VKSIVVIPTYNEAENIALLIPALREAAPEVDILVVDDGSPDGTGDIAAAMEGVRVLRRPGKLGLGTAYIQALSQLLDEGYERLAHMDADLSHDPKVLPRLLEALDTYDAVIGSRYVAGGAVENWGIHRRILSRTANFVAGMILGMSLPDATSGFRAYRREVLQAIDLPSIKSEGYVFLVEMAYRTQQKGFRLGSVPITFREREHGVSKMSIREARQGFTNLLRIRFSRD